MLTMLRFPQGAGVVFATLGEFKRAADALSTLTSVRPNDAEAWRLLVRGVGMTTNMLLNTSVDLPV